jgi:hypothetical protein
MVGYVDSVSDSISLTDSTAGVFGVVRSASDTIVILDVQSSIVGISGICSETISLLDEASNSGVWSAIPSPSQNWVTVFTT